LKTLAPEPNDIVISKHRYSGFYQTSLDDTLKARRIKYLIVIGCVRPASAWNPRFETRRSGTIPVLCSETVRLSRWDITRHRLR
jgi:hypothetical protein